MNPSLRDTVITGIIDNSMPDVRRGIEALSRTRKGFDPSWALTRAIKYAQPDMVTYLLNEGGASTDGLKPFAVGAAAVGRKGVEEEVRRVERTWGVLVERAWDINVREPYDAVLAPGNNLLILICDNEPMVQWCLQQGALATDPPDLDPLITPPLLEAVASKGSISTFELLQEHGAKITRRCLHRAVEAAAFAAPEQRVERMDMVKFLVEKCGIDVNALDVAEGDSLPNHWGTPAAYAVHAAGGNHEGAGKVVGWLLERGADPTIKDCFGNHSVISLAEHVGNRKIQEALRDWEKKRKG